MSEINHPCLVLICRETLQLFHSPSYATDAFEVNGIVFREITGYFWNGFYDWLRNDAGQVLGIGWIAEPIDRYADIFRSLDYVERDDYYLYFYFSLIRDFNYGKSGDQDFDQNRVFLADDGTYAVSFATDWLTLDEIEIIKQHPVQWANLIWL